MTRRINIPDPQELLRHIAGIYQSATRVIMEYIDNSLDDDEDLLKGYEITLRE